MHAIIAIALKDLKLLVRDRGSAFFTLAFPLLLAVFFGSIFPGGGSGGAMAVVLVDEDGGEAARKFAADLASAAGVKLTQLPTRQAGEALVQKGKAVACVVLPKGFQERSENMFGGEPLTIEGIVDPARKAEAGLLTGKLNEIAFQRLSTVFSGGAPMRKMIEQGRRSISAGPDVSDDRRRVFMDLFSNLDQVAELTDTLNDSADSQSGAGSATWKPIEVNVRELAAEKNLPKNAYELSFPQGVVWGLMGCVTAFGTSLATERARGTLMRLTISPVTKSQILIGKALACFVACLAIQAMLLTLGTLVFRVHVRAPALMAIAVVVSSFGFTGVMMALAGLSRTEGSANGMGRAVILILAMIGGGTLPLFLMPPFVQTVSSISPFKWATIVTEGAIWRGFTPADMVLPCFVLLAFGVAGFVVGVTAFRWSESK